MKHALITGAAGFIGSHLTDALLIEGWRVTGVDNFDPFYDPAVKRSSVRSHLACENYAFVEADIRDRTALSSIRGSSFDVIVHLAAKAGVRPSIENPREYQDVNVGGTQNVLEFARQEGVRQFVFASSSSVYGVNPHVPWREDNHVLMPISPYASTKVSGELMGHVYSHLYGIRFIALRFFTVFGPRQRPDLAIHKFAQLILDGAPLPIYGDGTSSRDYTYIDDVIRGIRSAMNYTGADYEVLNLGSGRPISLLEMVRTLQNVTAIPSTIEYLGNQPGDVPRTFADIGKARRLLGYEPQIAFAEGVSRFSAWHTQARKVAGGRVGNSVERSYEPLATAPVCAETGPQ